MPQTYRDSMTVPVKPFLYQPRPAAFTLAHLLTAQAVGVVCALVGWPLFFVVTMALPLNLIQQGRPIPDWFTLAYSAGQFMAFGAILGLAQLWVISRWVPGKQGWLISSSLIGLVVFPAAAFIAARLALWPAAGALSMPWIGAAGALGGLLLGIAQAPFLGTRRSGWRLASALTWAVAAPAVILLVERLAPVIGM